MSLLDSIKSLLGLEREQRVPSGESRVTVERERGGVEPATAAENAVKGTDADGVDTAPDVSDDETSPGEPSAAETDATASTGSLVDEDAGIEPAEAVAEADTDTGPAAEPAEAAGPVADESDAGVEDGEVEETDVEAEEPDDSDVEAEAEEVDTGAETEDVTADAEAEAEAEDADTETEDTDAEATAVEFEGPEAEEATDSIRGIGASYAGRLSEAGVETVGELASAEPAALSEATGVSEKRLAGWVEQARDRLE